MSKLDDGTHREASAATDEPRPVQWYVFFSEKYQREYFFEPKSQVVSWVMPDSMHPYGEYHEAPLSSSDNLEPPPVSTSRRVAFRDPISTGSSSPRQVAVPLVELSERTFASRDRSGCIILVLGLLVLVCAFSELHSWKGQATVQEALGWHKEHVVDTIIHVGKDMSDAIPTLGMGLGPMEAFDEPRDDPMPDSAPDGLSRCTRGPTDNADGAGETSSLEETCPGEQSNKVSRHRCFIPFAPVFSRGCRRFSKRNELFDLHEFLNNCI